jgi:cytochrome c peroxidase
MKTNRYLVLLLGIALLSACGGNSKKADPTQQNEEKKAILTKAQSYFTAITGYAENTENPLSEEKIKLGKILYFDDQLSENGKISCNSCHNLNQFGVDNLPTSPGADGTLGTRNSPTVFNAAFHETQFWDGRAKDVEEQAGMPITNPVEMMMPDENYVIDRVKSSALYQEMFKAVYPEDADPISFKNITYAIAAFERTLVTPSRFDDYLGGNLDALTYEEALGLETFINTGCIACHRGIVLGGGALQKFPLFGNYEEKVGSSLVDKGKFEATKNEADAFLFKPQALRNIEKTAPYYHDGKVAELHTAVKLMAEFELNKTLSDIEVNSIVAFLKTLTADIPEEVKAVPEELSRLY